LIIILSSIMSPAFGVYSKNTSLVTNVRPRSSIEDNSLLATSIVFWIVLLYFSYKMSWVCFFQGVKLRICIMLKVYGRYH